MKNYSGDIDPISGEKPYKKGEWKISARGFGSIFLHDPARRLAQSARLLRMAVKMS